MFPLSGTVCWNGACEKARERWNKAVAHGEVGLAEDAGVAAEAQLDAVHQVKRLGAVEQQVDDLDDEHVGEVGRGAELAVEGDAAQTQLARQLHADVAHARPRLPAGHKVPAVHVLHRLVCDHDVAPATRSSPHTTYVRLYALWPEIISRCVPFSIINSLIV